MFGRADIAEQDKILSDVSKLVDAGVLRSTLREEMEKIDAATHAAQESARAIGKTVLSGF
ncbi:hypothetical protein [Methylopila sp. Yamaguchi]|uniref:hypothetical protein n=1 Tax=Methylopila sp. Yamaguchi TaxID=1437817 RepID=UPI000CBA1403|nr:hypothetical protein [Methylopila sp. Yamaguchi]GBD47801.1 hypothetical protein METY_1014 [Methylopila sp. Yamaguchi]